jgi:DNA-binding NarL/FixJ family response regulator
MEGDPREQRTPARIAIVERRAMVRDAIVAVVGRAAGMRVVAAAGDRAGALAQCAEPPDVLVVSVDADADLDALEAAGRAPACTRTIVLGGDGAHGAPKRAAAAGASGFVAKRDPADTLLRAIARVSEGEVWFDSATLAALIAEAAGIGPPAPARDAFAALGLRDREIVLAVAEGLRNRDVAERCGVTEPAVRHALTRIFRALGVCDRMELARLALELGVAPPAGGAS